MAKKKLLLIAVGVIVLFTLTGCGLFTNKSDDTTRPTPSPSLTDEVVQADSSSWTMAINATTLDGEPITERDFGGNVLTVLNVWATWCPPCIAELPYLQEVSEYYKDRGVQIVGVMQDGLTEMRERDEAAIEAGKELLADAGADYLVILPDDTLIETFINRMQYFPTTFILDANGEVVETVIGSKDAQGWKDVIEGALKKIE